MGVLAVSMIAFFGLKTPLGTEGKRVKDVKVDAGEL
jgi:hypothetical protein